MRLVRFAIAASIGPLFFGTPHLAGAQEHRDFLFTDEQGHLLMRFAGAAAGGLEQDQIDEVVNAELSSMVHDRLRADLRIDAEPVDAPWANEIQPRLERHVSQIDFEFSAIAIECKSLSCRLLLEQPARLGITEHEAVMEIVQRSIRAFIAADPVSFDPVFLIAAYDKDFQTPSIKVYLSRTAALQPR